MVVTLWSSEEEAARELAEAGTPGADLELEFIHTSTGYTLFVFGIHTGYTL